MVGETENDAEEERASDAREREKAEGCRPLLKILPRGPSSPAGATEEEEDQLA